VALKTANISVIEAASAAAQRLRSTGRRLVTENPPGSRETDADGQDKRQKQRPDRNFRQKSGRQLHDARHDIPAARPPAASAKTAVAKPISMYSSEKAAISVLRVAPSVFSTTAS
jgi:hypothetical protein